MLRTVSGKSPFHTLPPSAVDCHAHFFDAARYGPVAGGPLLPADALFSHYDQVQEWLGLERVVVVQGNAYQKDNRLVLDALAHYGNRARGVVAVDPTVSDEELADLMAQGVRAARIMDLLEGPVGLDQALAVNARIQPFGWSMIVQFDGRDMVQHLPLLEKIRGDYVIDHTGKFLEPVSVSSPAFHALLRLLDRGNCYVKLSGCYETSKSGFPDYEDVAVLSRALIKHAPDRILWGSNFPHLMAKSPETYPDDAHLLDLLCSWAETADTIQKIFVDNPARLYGFSA